MSQRIVSIRFRVRDMDLSRPYRIAGEEIDTVENVFLELTDQNGLKGFGVAAPMIEVCGETTADTMKALDEAAALLEDSEYNAPADMMQLLAPVLKDCPAAAAAVDMALLDVHTKALGLPLCTFLGQYHKGLATSVTIGITDTDEALAQLHEFLHDGFTVIKLKIGDDVEHDINIVRRLRESGGDGFVLRVDANQGYSREDLNAFLQGTAAFGIELVEQPFIRGDVESLEGLPDAIKLLLAADEDLISPADVDTHAAALHYGIWNLKLMKSGGILAARKIAAAAGHLGKSLMWGCNDESRVSIAAALHAGYSCPATKFIDLDGAFDISRDIATGGFTLHEGRLWLTEQPGLGVAVEW